MNLILNRFLSFKRKRRANHFIYRKPANLWALGLKSILARITDNGHFGKTTFLLLFLVLPILASGQDVTLKRQNVSLFSVLKEIEQQTGYSFFSNRTEIDVVKVTIDIQALPLERALKAILITRGFSYNIVGKTIAIKKNISRGAAVKGAAGDNQNNSLLGEISGHVSDENGIPLKNIVITDRQTEIGTVSHDDGSFTLHGMNSSGTLIFSGSGFLEQFVNYSDSVTLSVTMKRGKESSINLAEVSIQSVNDAQSNPNRLVDLTNRSYMTLSQVLQGTIPGLTLQTTTSTTKVPTSVETFVNRINNQTVGRSMRLSIEEFLNLRGRVEGQRIIDQILSGRTVIGTSVYTVSRTITTLVPQVRGANGFTGSTDGMLVVIDGFPQDGFPANYPMSNVESIEVVKDPRELIKWGTRANNGLILIRTKTAKKGEIKINYSGNFYLEPRQRFDRGKLRLAGTSDYLNYLKDVDSVFRPSYENASFNFTPAQRLFAQNRLGLINTGSYQQSLDSLRQLDNESQLRELQQNRYSQNHTLDLSGGNNVYRFSLLGNYVYDKPHEIGSYNKNLMINLNNDFNLLKNKLHITWLINYSDMLSRTGYNLSANVPLEPYQMLLDNQGNYTYDYSDNFSPLANSIITRNGYFNHGVNLLEDARSNGNISKNIQKRTNLNFRWSLIPGLNFSGSVYYDGSTYTTNQIYGQESSYARQLVNNYGEYSPNGINFYVPFGDIMQLNNRRATQLNVRSGLSYDKTFGKHQISIAVGAGGASTDNTRPNNGTIYGYSRATGSGSALYLPAPNPRAGISNYYSLLSNVSVPANYPYNLSVPLNGDTTRNRNLNGNASFAYQYAKRLTISSRFNTVLSPIYGQLEPYSSLTTENYDITGIIFKRLSRIIQGVSLSTGIDRIKLPDLPASYANSRNLQVNWGNYAIWVTGLTPTQQQGQSSRNFYQKLNLSFLDSSIVANVAYNTQRTTGNLQSLSTDPLGTSPGSSDLMVSRYLSVGVIANLRRSLLRLQFNYSRSPEGQTLYNGAVNYDIAHEKYFKSNAISMLNVGFKMDDISAFQGLGLMMSTNVASNGSYSQAVNSSFSLLPPNNRNYEAYTRMALADDVYTFDLRYYNRITSGLNNFTPSLTDPSTGLSNRTTYSIITNKGVEGFFKVRVYNSKDFTYSTTLNGAYNVNIVNSVPDPIFYGSADYTTMYRNGYDISNLWSVRSAPLNNQGNPQIYNANGQMTSTLDSATIVSSSVYSGKTRAPWNGGFIHDLRYKHFFARASITFNLGHVMRTYIPSMSSDVLERSILIADRWGQPGDENRTIVPRMDPSNAGSQSLRAFVVQNGTNSILSASNIRLQEVMIGCTLPDVWNKKLGIEGCSIALTGQNLAYWARNPYNVDPAVVDLRGQVSLPLPSQYSLNINISF